MDVDSLVTSHPVYVPVSHPDEITEIFDRISYAKVKYNVHCFDDICLQNNLLFGLFDLSDKPQ